MPSSARPEHPPHAPSGELGQLQAASWVLQHLAKGVRRVPLHKMACHPCNRGGMGVNGKHAHAVARRIVEIDGLAPFRYKHGIAIEPNPGDMLENARFTNTYVEKQAGLLSPVEYQALPGSIAKTHLWHGLFTLSTGRFFWDDSQDPMQPNRKDQALMTTLSDGMFYEVLPYEAWAEHRPAVEALMNGDNLDAACAMAEHEVALIASYFRSSRLVVPAPGETQFDAVLKASGPVGARFSREDKVRCFNFANLIRDQQMDIISDTHSGWVRPKVVTLSPVTAEAVANLPTGTVWVLGAAAAGRVLWMAWSG